MKKNCVSIIVPIFNSEKFLEKCIFSIINQTYSNVEIILIDDGSTDKSLQICNKFKMIDDRIKVISKDNAGVSSARNVGIENASGEYITFIDSDDYIDKNMIKKSIEIFMNNVNCDLIIYNIINQKNKKRSHMKNTFESLKRNRFFLKKLIVSEKINSPCNKLYKTEIIKKNNIKFDTSLFVAEDLLFNLDYIKKIDYVYNLNEDLYYYYYNYESVSNNFRYEKYNNLIYVNDKAIDYYKNDKVINKAFKFIRMKNIIYILRKMITSNLSNREIEKYIKIIKKENYKVFNTGNGFFLKIFFKIFYIFPLEKFINLIRR